MELNFIGNIKTDLDEVYYDKEEINEIFEEKSNITHNHNSIYYTKEEVDTIFNGE